MMETAFYRAYYELEGRHWWFIGRRAIFLRILEREARDRPVPLDILDFGCGTGAFLSYLERFGTVSAVDGDQAAVGFCHERGRDEVRHVAPGQPLPFDDSSFDVVTALDVIEHIADDVSALRELRRVLRPGGLLLVAVPAFELLWGDQDEISHHFRRYTDATLRRALIAASFEVERSTYFNTWLFAPIALVRIARRLIRPANAAQTDFDVGPARLNRALGWILASEAPVVSRARLPFGVSVLALARR
jgi:SAM-dependent methyltransferase